MVAAHVALALLASGLMCCVLSLCALHEAWVDKLACFCVSLSLIILWPAHLHFLLCAAHQGKDEGKSLDPGLKGTAFSKSAHVHVNLQVPFSSLEEGSVITGPITDVWLYHGIQVDFGAASDGYVPSLSEGRSSRSWLCSRLPS